MSSSGAKQWEKLKQWSPALLYIAGSLYLLLALSYFVEIKPPFINFLGPFLYYSGPVSSILGIAGIVGLYPNLSDRASWLSWAGAIFLAIAAITFIVGFVGNHLVKLYQSQSFIPLLSFIPHITMATFFAGHLLFGIATFSTDYYPNILAYLLLVPVVLTGVEITRTIMQAQGNLTWLVVTTMGIILALNYVAMGYIIDKQHAITYPKIAAFWSRIKKVV